MSRPLLATSAVPGIVANELVAAKAILGAYTKRCRSCSCCVCLVVLWCCGDVGCQNDANEQNVLIDETRSHVTGIIDFGDCLHTCLIFELVCAHARVCACSCSLRIACCLCVCIACCLCVCIAKLQVSSQQCVWSAIPIQYLSNTYEAQCMV